MAIGWKLYADGRTPPTGQAVAPEERLSWPRTVGFGAQHVVAMFGGTFVFPLVMGLNANLALMMSGIGTILFLLVVGGKVPSYLGTSASFVGGVAAIRAQGGSSADVVGAILVSGVVLALVGLVVQRAGARVVNRLLPPAVTGAVVALIGLNLASVAATVYWPQDQWVALLTMLFVIVGSLVLRGFLGRIAILLGLVFGYLVSWIWDVAGGKIHSITGSVSTPFDHFRTDFSAVGRASWLGLPHFTAPHVGVSFSLLVLPAVIALIAENAGHVKAVGEMTKRDLDPYLGRAILGDGVATVVASAVGGSPTTTYAENIGVMAATRVYSTAAYWCAAVVAILLGLCPKVGALVAGVPGGVLGGITIVLYGMIGLLGAKIWKENRVDFANPVNLVPLGAGLILGIGGITLQVTDHFSIGGIALGTIVAVGGWHLCRVLAPAEVRAALDAEREPLGRPAAAAAAPAPLSSPETRGGADPAALEAELAERRG